MDKGKTNEALRAIVATDGRFTPLDGHAECIAIAAATLAEAPATAVDFATVRDGEDAWHIECRFADGQKFAAVKVDIECEALAHRICDFLNAAPSAAGDAVALDPETIAREVWHLAKVAHDIGGDSEADGLNFYQLMTGQGDSYNKGQCEWLRKEMQKLTDALTAPPRAEAAQPAGDAVAGWDAATWSRMLDYMVKQMLCPVDLAKIRDRVSALLTTPPRAEAGRVDEPWEAANNMPPEFAHWFRTNYPGPDTIIHRPDWHAPKIWRAAIYALQRMGPTPLTLPAAPAAPGGEAGP